MGYMLVINPGSTSTKIAVYDNKSEVLNQTIRHDSEKLDTFENIIDQYEFRVETIEKILASKDITIDKFDVVVGRGGMLKPIEGGAWIINEAMLDDLRKAERGEHASNLGAVIAHNIAKKAGVKAYIVDPVVVDQMDDVARISGIPEIKRISVFHALNQKASARKLAVQLGEKYEDINLIVTHMGGGVTVGAHKKGRVIDVNNGVYGDGPFTPERSGSLPPEQVIQMCFSGKYTLPEMIKKIHGKGGLVAYLGTADCRVVEEEIRKGNKKFCLIYDAMAYQIAKEIGGMAVVLDGEVDGIILTGGLAFSKNLMDKIIKKIKFIGKVYVVPGENEMEALRDGVLMALDGKMPLHEYA
jgi:butyrate kinase